MSLNQLLAGLTLAISIIIVSIFTFDSKNLVKEGKKEIDIELNNSPISERKKEFLKKALDRAESLDKKLENFEKTLD